MNATTITPTARTTETARYCVALATWPEREHIAALRHEVYALELGQHTANAAGRLADALDAYNLNLVARIGGAVGGFVSLTPRAARPTRSTSISRGPSCHSRWTTAFGRCASSPCRAPTAAARSPRC